MVAWKMQRHPSSRLLHSDSGMKPQVCLPQASRAFVGTWPNALVHSDDVPALSVNPFREELGSGSPMEKPDICSARDQKQRRHRRFDLHFQVCLSFPSEGKLHKLMAISKNVSIGGLLLKVSDQVPLRTPVSWTMDARGSWSRRPVRLRGEGEVVRVEHLGSGAGFAIAIECKTADHGDGGSPSRRKLGTSQPAFTRGYDADRRFEPAPEARQT